MTLLRHILVAALLTTGTAHAQSSGEIAFWESVRNSANPAELQAYIDQYPNGTFVVLAKSRLAALERKPAAAPARPVAPAPAASTAQSVRASDSRMPLAGDAWTYRLSYPRLRGQWGQTMRPPQMHTVRIGTVAEDRIIDQFSIDGGTPIPVEHPRGSYLLPEGVSIYSPYLVAFGGTGQARLGAITIRDAMCAGQYNCRASGRIHGQETVTVPAGQFLASKVVIEQEWQPVAMSGQQGARFVGGRTLTVWYVPELRRAVRYSSRQTVGDMPPIETNFDLELVSFDLK
jgi:hypothetical protein